MVKTGGARVHARRFGFVSLRNSDLFRISDFVLRVSNESTMSSSEQTLTPSAAWFVFSILTVGCWGLYGVFLHTGQAGMSDPVNGRYKAFLWVGIAYFLTAVLAPLALLALRGATWSFPLKGVGWSLVAGLLGAMGALGVLLAFGAKGTPAVVMSIVFAGAPIVNAVFSLLQHPPAGGFLRLPWPFLLGIVLAATGGCLVTLYKPAPAPSHAKAQAASLARVGTSVNPSAANVAGGGKPASP